MNYGNFDRATESKPKKMYFLFILNSQFKSEVRPDNEVNPDF